MKTLILLFGIVLACCGFTSCETLHPTRPITTLVTNNVPAHVVYVTNLVVQPAQVVYVTNVVAGETVVKLVTNTIPPLIVTNQVFVPETNVVFVSTNGYEANPAFLAAVANAKALNASVNPTPSEPIVSGILGGLTIAAGLLAGYKNNKLKREQEAHGDTSKALGVAQDVGKTLVENFESIRTAALKIPEYAKIDHQVMDAVKTNQLIAGSDVKGIIHDLVEQHTNDTVS